MGSEDWIPYTEREAWQDVTPVPQNDGPDPVCPIAYSAEYTSAMDMFRAVSAQPEYSERVLALTQDIISMNPGHYTIWLYRKDALLALNADLQQELTWIKELAVEQPKCYQLWHHRQMLVEHLQDASQELAFIDDQLAEDAKNFHAWSYRQWVIKRFGLWSGELAYTEQMLDNDVRNNSAWNQRYFALHQQATPATPQQLEEELSFTMVRIRLAPSNESAWNYLAGTVRHAPTVLLPKAEQLVQELQENEINKTPALLAFLVELQQTYPDPQQPRRKEQALWACDTLADEMDRIRERYWRHMRELLA